MLAAGGTIDKDYFLAGQLEIGPPAAHRLLEVLTTDLRIEVRSIVANDSLDITDADRQLLLEAVDHAESASVVITHGTDTLTHTAEYLSRDASTSTVELVVLTGAWQRAAMAVSDAALNQGVAVLASQTLRRGCTWA